jgi:hypothetical protein
MTKLNCWKLELLEDAAAVAKKSGRVKDPSPHQHLENLKL